MINDPFITKKEYRDIIRGLKNSQKKSGHLPDLKCRPKNILKNFVRRKLEEIRKDRKWNTLD